MEKPMNKGNSERVETQPGNNGGKTKPQSRQLPTKIVWSDDAGVFSEILLMILTL